MTTPTEHLTTGGRPTGLTRFACPTSSSYRFKLIPGTCPPLAAGWWGVGALGIASPYRAARSLVLSPRYCRTEPGPSHRGQEGQQEPLTAAFVVLPYPSPGRGITASRWRFGMVSRCSAYGAQGQPGTVGREGDKSVEAVPRPWLTFNLAQMHRGMDKIGPRSAGYPFPGSVIFAAQKALSNSTYWGFSLCGAANPIS